MQKINKKSQLAEIIRFVITGLIAAIVDFLFSFLTSFAVQKMGLPATSVWCTVIGTTIGFITSVIVNYILSVKWVYQDFDRSQMDKHKKTHILVFVILSAIGLLIGIGIMAIFKVSLQNGLNINIDNWMNVDIPSDYSFWQKIGTWISSVFMSAIFWWFVFAFIVKTLIVLFYNYVSRKKFLFKDKKN